MMIFAPSPILTLPARPPDLIASGQYVCTETATTITGLPANLVELLVQADSGNKATILIGGETSQPIQLPPGSSLTFGEINAPAALYVKKDSSKTAKLNWIARYPDTSE